MDDLRSELQVDAPERRRVRRDLLAMARWFIGLSGIYLLAVWLVCGRIGFPLDDAFIHLQFARNLFIDGQMAFNRGVPSSGSTAPLYAALLAGVYAVVRDWYAASLVLGGICGLGSAWAVYGLLHAWTGRRELARWGGMLTVFVNPTIVAAYSGMETPVYTLLFLLGLWVYGARRYRLLASGVLAAGIWLRPEFLALLPFICLERLVATWRETERRWGALVAELLLHGLIWAGMAALYAGYHWHQDRHLVPSTFGAKAVVMLAFVPPWLKGLPAAVADGQVVGILRALLLWPLLITVTVMFGLLFNCAPLGAGLKPAMRVAWRAADRAAPARRLAVITLVCFPLARGLVDPTAAFWFQFQRYYAHLTPLLILLVIGALPQTGAIVQGARWDWRRVPLRVQRVRTARWAALFMVVRGAMAVGAVSNINTMQVSLGRWVRENTAQGTLVATNDIGAIGFISQRPILDTVGLVEPALVTHYMDGGSLLEYLEARRPAYVLIFPNWYPELCARHEMMEPVHSVKLTWNQVCGGPEMVVYRPHWEAGNEASMTRPAAE